VGWDLIKAIQKRRLQKRFNHILLGKLVRIAIDQITTGPLKKTHNKIKTMQRRAYGFRAWSFFRLKIVVLHESKDALTR